MGAALLLPSAVLTLLGLALLALPDEGRILGTWRDLFGLGVASFLLIGVALAAGGVWRRVRATPAPRPRPLRASLGRELAVGCLLVAGFAVLDAAFFYVVLKAGSVAAIGLVDPVDTIHFDYHYAVASALSLGTAAVLFFAAVGPVRSGADHGWQVALIAGIAPSIGILAESLGVLLSDASAGTLVVTTHSGSTVEVAVRHLHASTLAFVGCWLAGTLLARMSRAAQRG